MASSDETDANNTIYYGGKGRGHRKYFHAVQIVPGQTEPYVLPPNAKACPIESCPRYQRECKPHWRVNEHMKLRHGWPRKNTQPHTDKRRNGSQRSRRSINFEGGQSAHSQTTNSEQPNSGMTGDGGDDTSDLSSAESDVSVMARPKRVTKPTAKRRSQIDDMKKDISSTDVEIKQPPPKQLRTLRAPKAPIAVQTYVTDSDEIMQDVPSDVNDVSKPAIADDVDHEMVDMTKAHIGQLRTEKPPGRQLAMKLAREYQKLIDNKNFRVNTVIDSDQIKLITPLYMTLAEKHNEQIKAAEIPPPNAQHKPLSIVFPNTTVLPTRSQPPPFPPSPYGAQPSSAGYPAQPFFPAFAAQSPSQAYAGPPLFSAFVAQPPSSAYAGQPGQPFFPGFAIQYPPAYAAHAPSASYSAQPPPSPQVARSPPSTRKTKPPPPPKVTRPSPRPSPSAAGPEEQTNGQHVHRNQIAMPRPGQLQQPAQLPVSNGFTAQNSKKNVTSTASSPISSLTSSASSSGVAVAAPTEKPRLKLTLKFTNPGKAAKASK